MKRAIYLVVFGVIVFFVFLFEKTQNSDYIAINNAIGNGKVESLSAYFAPEIKLNFNNKQNICTKSQAAKVIGDFFDKHKPQEYTSSHNRNYFFGTMTTSEGLSYKVDYTLKTVNNQSVITGLYVY